MSKRKYTHTMQCPGCLTDHTFKTESERVKQIPPCKACLKQARMDRQELRRLSTQEWIRRINRLSEPLRSWVGCSIWWEMLHLTMPFDQMRSMMPYQYEHKLTEQDKEKGMRKIGYSELLIRLMRNKTEEKNHGIRKRYEIKRKVTV